MYVLVGLLFALAFVLAGVRRIDPDAVEGTRGFRALIFPGVVALWPLMALRWKAGTPPPIESNAHRARSGGPR